MWAMFWIIYLILFYAHALTSKILFLRKKRLRNFLFRNVTFDKFIATTYKLRVNIFNIILIIIIVIIIT
jgi:hypothetical protein